VDNRKNDLIRPLWSSAAPPPPGMPRASVPHLGEVDRWEWRIGDGGDPYEMLSAFLTDAGLPVGDLRQTTVPRSVHGAAILISAAASARAIAAPDSAPTPCPEVPDVAAVVYAETAAPLSAIPGLAGWSCNLWEESWTDDEHVAAVSTVRDAIARGDVYQANVVGHRRAAFSGDRTAAMAAVTSVAGAVHGGAMTGDGWAVATASPECLVAVDAGRIETRPIKGTAARTPAGRRALIESAKERAEHIMIVDLERNDFSRIAETGSVRVEELFALREWCDLWQAESVVSAELAEGVGLADMLRAVAPGGSVTGTPKLSALALLAQLEPVGRGPSMGALGYVMAGRLSLGVTIRTAAFTEGAVHLWTGGGITWGSDPQGEVEEARAKSLPLQRALSSRPS
jgi:para-aminobenzoate synthetase component 1